MILSMDSSVGVHCTMDHLILLLLLTWCFLCLFLFPALPPSMQSLLPNFRSVFPEAPPAWLMSADASCGGALEPAGTGCVQHGAGPASPYGGCPAAPLLPAPGNGHPNQAKNFSSELCFEKLVIWHVVGGRWWGMFLLIHSVVWLFSYKYRSKEIKLST